MRSRNVVGVIAAALTMVALAGCAHTPDSKVTLGQLISKNDSTKLGAEKPVRAVCAGLKLMAAQPKIYGLTDLQAASPIISMGDLGAANWLLMIGNIEKAAGNDWLKSSDASKMFYRDYLVFSTAISDNLDTETSITTPEVTSTLRALRSIQDGCRRVFRENAYAIVQ
jgi:hypothetical protein